MTKPAFAICEQQRCRSACASRQSDQRLCCSLLRKYSTSSFFVCNFKTLASLWSWACRFESYLVVKPRRRVFSWRGSNQRNYRITTSWKASSVAEWLRLLIFSTLNCSSSHHCGFEPCFGHMWDQQNSACGWLGVFSWESPVFAPPNSWLCSTIILTGRKTPIKKENVWKSVQDHIVSKIKSKNKYLIKMDFHLFYFHAEQFYIWTTSGENLFLPYANNKGADQPAHMRSLDSAFVIGCLGSSFYMQNLKPLASLCSCADRFVPYLVAIPEDRFSRGLAKLTWMYWIPSSCLWSLMHSIDNMSLITRKHVFGVCDQGSLKPACAATEAK